MTRFIIWLINGFLSTFGFSYLFYNLSASKTKISLGVVVIFLFGVFSVTLIEYYHVAVIDSLFFFIFFPIMFIFLNRMKFRKLIFYLVAVWFYGILIDLVLIFLIALISYFLGFNFDKEPELVSMILTVLVSLILILVSKRKFMKNFTDKVCSKIANIKYLDFLVILFAMFVLAMAIIMLANVKNLRVDILLSIILILSVFVFVLLIKFKITTEENIMYLNTLRENNEFYIKMEDENRIFKHNLVAKLLSIKSVSNKKAMALIEDLIIQFNKSVNFSQSMKVIPYGLNGIIYQKLYPYMKELNIDISNELDYDIFDVLKPRRYNVFVEKMVIALDNAIESCLKSNNRSLVINIFDEDNSISIEIENTIGNDINLDLLGNKNYSTKGNKHGLGLFSAFRNNEASLNVKIVNNIFVSKIIAKKHPVD